LNLVCGLVSTPIFGKIYDKVRNVKKLLFVCGVAMSAGLACNAVTITSSSEYLVVSNILVGVFSGGMFTITNASAKEASVNTRAEMKNKENIETTLTKRSNRGH
jgi:MFS family permease